MEHRVIRHIRDMIEAEGLIIVSVTQNKHYKIVVSNGKETRLLVTSVSCSDQRAHYKIRRTIKNLFR
jgi:hypothetical protein